MDPLWLLLIGIAVVVGGILFLRLQPFLALLAGALIVSALTPSAALEEFALDRKMTPEAAVEFARESPGERVAREFGRTAGRIGILIAMAAIIGKCLLDSGAADRIVRSSLRGVGERHAPVAFLGSSFLLAIPVFFDTVFFLMVPLAKALALRRARQYGLYIMTIIAGGTMAHSLVPPTPGPLFVAAELNVDLGLMILAGTALGLFTSTCGYLYAVWANGRWEIPLRESADISLADLDKLAQRQESQLPPLWLSVLPIVLPILLIAGSAIIANLDLAHSPWLSPVHHLGDKNIALIIAAAIALGMLAWQKRAEKTSLSPAIQSALAGGGLIILITSAGGAFGAVLQHTGISHRIQDLATAYQLALLPLAFFVTALVRTAQGSATVAMITAVGILAHFAEGNAAGFHPIYFALAIGCGSKPFPWMNDSGFWVIAKMSGMTEAETIKTFSFMLTIMGLAGLGAIMICARLFPLV